MRPITRVLAGTSILLAPLLWGIGDQLRMAAEPPASVGIVNDGYGVAEAAATFASIDANRGTYVAASFVVYLAVLFAVPALLALWRLSVARAPRWAWAGAILAVVSVIGETVHLVAYFGLSQLLSAHEDLEVAAEIFVAAESNGLLLALIVPYLLGLLAPIPQAIALRRARVVPLWAAIAVVTGVVVLLVAGSTPISSALATVLLVGGLLPAARSVVRRRESDVRPAIPEAVSA
jgi:hypothetical protein